MLMDEVNTPDSSRYWMADDYEKRFEKKEEPRKLDKEYVRTWLVDKGFTGDGKPPKLTDELRIEAAARYMEVVETFTAEPMQLDIGPVINRSELKMRIHHTLPELIAPINEAISKMKRDGTIQRIIDSYTK